MKHVYKHGRYIEMDMKIDMNMKMNIDIDMDMYEDMEIWTRTWEHGRGYGNMAEDMKTWRGHENMDGDVEILTRPWKHGNMDVETW
jgi:hypothetical protein